MDIDNYFKLLSEKFEKEYELAKNARAKGFDPRSYVEIKPAPDLASRVEGLINVNGIEELIRAKLSGQGRSRLAFDVAGEICTSPKFDGYETTKRMELAVRVGTAILTEGVLVAPTEGISSLARYRNQDGTEYVAIAYAGPIRGAGGTAAALSVALADYVRKLFRIGVYKPTQEEVERAVEEIELYHTRAARLQYRPPDDDIRAIISNCPVCIDGVPTETIEVGVHRGLLRIKADGKQIPVTDRVRGGIALVTCEGIAQKAKKMLKETKGVGLDWGWLNNVIKADVKKSEEKQKSGKEMAFLDELVAGRPILSYPGHMGGFRLRYGRSRLTGIASKGVSPATMAITGSFIALGTQLKIDYPGKGCIAVPVDSIEGPFVKLRSGDAFRVNDAETAEKIKGEVTEILSLGDMLVTYGDFKKSNTQLRPSSYVEEYWDAELAAAGGDPVNHKELGFKDAFWLSMKHGIPVHPKFLFEFQGVGSAGLRKLAAALAAALGGGNLFDIEEITLENDPEVKRVLELLNVPHRLVLGKAIVYGDYAQSLAASLGFADKEGVMVVPKSAAEAYPDDGDVLQQVNALAPFRIMKRSAFIGSRIGRPEKAKERLMKPAPHVLFPAGMQSKDRNLAKMYAIDSKKFGSSLEVELARYKCSSCQRIVDSPFCYDCQKHAIPERKCSGCGAIVEEDICPKCSSPANAWEQRKVDLVKAVSNSMKKLGINRLPDAVKGVKGLTNKDRIGEQLEKGILRAQNGVFIFKDGTARFDATDVPMTHFYPKEIGTGVEKLRSLGYDRDCFGNELTSDEQLLELRHQDVILSRRGGEYMLKVSRFVDQMLEGLYGLDRFYNAVSAQEMIGKLVVTLSPHTSCGVLGRIIGFTDANVGFAHPYTITARRRNCDGDEDTTMLLLDALINFSRDFLPAGVGGTMDTPLILTLNVMPDEVDDEVHALEVVRRYPLSFYEKSLSYPYPSEVNIEIVENRLGDKSVFDNLWFTHESSVAAIANSPRRSSYTQFKTMQDKVDAEFRLMDMIYAIDRRDAARRLILSHFIPDLIGNLHSFSKQSFRCSSCNAKYRRVPLTGKCAKDGGKLLLTISKGGIEKYLNMAIGLAERYGLDPYIRQRLYLVRDEIKNIFFGSEDQEHATSGQFNLGRYI